MRLDQTAFSKVLPVVEPRIELVNDGLETDDGEQPGGEADYPGQGQDDENDQRFRTHRRHHGPRGSSSGGCRSAGHFISLKVSPTLCKKR